MSPPAGGHKGRPYGCRVLWAGEPGQKQPPGGRGCPPGGCDTLYYKEGNGRFWSVWQGTGVVLQLCYKCAGGVDLLRKMLYHAYRGKGSHTPLWLKIQKEEIQMRNLKRALSLALAAIMLVEIGRASCRERV